MIGSKQKLYARNNGPNRHRHPSVMMASWHAVGFGLPVVSLRSSTFLLTIQCERFSLSCDACVSRKFWRRLAGLELWYRTTSPYEHKRLVGGPSAERAQLTLLFLRIPNSIENEKHQRQRSNRMGEWNGSRFAAKRRKLPATNSSFLARRPSSKEKQLKADRERHRSCEGDSNL